MYIIRHLIALAYALILSGCTQNTVMIQTPKKNPMKAKIECSEDENGKKFSTEVNFGPSPGDG